MSDQFAARIRTWWPILLGHIAVWVAATIAHHTGVEVPDWVAIELVSAAASVVVWEAGRWLETRRGESAPARWARAAGRWLLALGLHTGQPTYTQLRATMQQGGRSLSSGAAGT